MIQLILLKEAIASVALEHPSLCSCKVCKAARGDKKAFEEILMELFLYD